MEWSLAKSLDVQKKKKRAGSIITDRRKERRDITEKPSPQETKKKEKQNERIILGKIKIIKGKKKTKLWYEAM